MAKKKMKCCRGVPFMVGLYAALIHAIWAVLIALGVGQTYLDWIFPLHMLSNPFNVTSFSLLNAALLVVVAFVCGYVATWLFMALWKLLKIKVK